MSTEPRAPAEAGGFIDGTKKILTVTLVAAVSAAVLGFVHSRTKDAVALAELGEQIEAFGFVLTEFDNEPLTTGREIEPPGGAAIGAERAMLFEAKVGDETVGYAVALETTRAYGPLIRLLVGARPDGTVTGVYILDHEETPGLGAKVTEGHRLWRSRDQAEGRPFLFQFANRRPGEQGFRVREDGGDIDSITASTITSRAVAEAITVAARAVQEVSGMIPATTRESEPEAPQSDQSEAPPERPSPTELKRRALALVLPEFDNRPLETAREVALPRGEALGSPRGVAYEARHGDELVGLAILISNQHGHEGVIELLVGGRPDGAVTGIFVLAHRETPGIADEVFDGQEAWKTPEEAGEEPYLFQFKGRRPGEYGFRIVQDGGDLDAVSGATVTSRAVARAVTVAARAIQAIGQAEEGEESE